MKLKIENIPLELRRQKIWVCFKIIPDPTPEKPHRTKKIPYNPNFENQKASSTDPNTWSDFETAANRLDQFDVLGIAIMPPFFGIDMDDCIENKILSPIAKDVIEKIGSYTEISPSGRGVRIITFSDSPGSKCKNSKLGLEMYSGARFLTITGNVLSTFKGVLEQKTTEVKEVYEKYMNLNGKLPDEFNIDLNKVFMSKNGEAMKSLWEGNWQQHYPSQSEADLFFCGCLAFWTAKDPEEMDKIFRKSKLYRTKWDDRHSSTGRTYGQMTIEKAISQCKNIFLPFDKDDVYQYAKFIRKKYKIINCAAIFYEYEKGVYKRKSDESIKTYILNFYKDKVKRHKVEEVIYFLKTICYVEPNELNNHAYLNLKNGLLNLKTFELLPHDPNILSTIQLDVNYRLGSICEKWQKTLNEILDNEQILILQEFFGLCLTRETKYEKVLYCIGAGANGKSVVLAILQAMLGKDNYAAVPIERFNNGHYLSRLFSKLANITAETLAKGEFSDSTFKTIVSGDPIEADPKYVQPFTYKPFCKLIIASNSLPRVNDRTSAYFRRLVILRFNRIFNEHEQNKNLKNELLEELDGIFQWALEGLKRLEERGYFKLSNPMLEEIEQYKKENDHVISFVEETCEVGPDKSISKADIYHFYRIWCERNGYNPLSMINFGKRLRSIADINEGRDSTAKRIPIWKGVYVDTVI